jgi:hypothetical protein
VLANWQDKPANLRRLAAQLGLGLESLVLLDDTAFERALAEAVHSPDRARKLRETGRFNLPAGANPVLSCASLAGTFGRQPVEGLVCAGGMGGNLVRLRVSMPKVAPTLADAPGFASAIVASLRAR